MKTIGVTELKAKLSANLASVKAGEEILVTERGRPIARIVPICETDLPERVSALALRGIVKLPRAKPEILEPRVDDRAGQLLRTLLDERRLGR